MKPRVWLFGLVVAITAAFTSPVPAARATNSKCPDPRIRVNEHQQLARIVHELPRERRGRRRSEREHHPIANREANGPTGVVLPHSDGSMGSPEARARDASHQKQSGRRQVNEIGGPGAAF